jgi:hypothetical protein
MLPSILKNLTIYLTSAATAVVDLIKGPGNGSSSTLSPGKRAQVTGQYRNTLRGFTSLGVLTAEEISEQNLRRNACHTN